MPRPTSSGKTSAARAAVVAAGKAAADAIAEADGEDAIDPDDDFGGVELDAQLDEDLPPPPAPPAPRAGVEQPSAPPATLLALGDPPDDPLAAQAWLHRAMVLSAHDAMTDTTISAATRRRELRTIAIAADKLVPTRDLWEARELVKRDRAQLEERQRARSAARPEPRGKAPAGAKVIPIRADK